MDFDYEKYVNAITKPAPSFKKEKKNAELKQGAKELAVAFTASGLIAGIVSLITLGLVGGIALVMAIILAPIMGLIMSLVGVGLVYVTAKILGGKGEFGTQFGLFALYYAPIVVISAVLNIIPMVGGLLAGLLSLYSLYPLTLSIKETHQLDTLKAVLAWLIPGIIAAVLLVILGGIIGLAMLGSSGIAGIS